MTFSEVMEKVTRGFETVGVAILVIGVAVAFIRAVLDLRDEDVRRAYERLRQDIGRSLLLGLEVLIAADLVRTVTIDPTLNSAIFLGVIVLVRTFLSFSLEIELDGVVPWRKRSVRRKSNAARIASMPRAFRRDPLFPSRPLPGKTTPVDMSRRVTNFKRMRHRPGRTWGMPRTGRAEYAETHHGGSRRHPDGHRGRRGRIERRRSAGRPGSHTKQPMVERRQRLVV